jgi:alkylated DNA repair dioxygenase AlkB
MAAENDTKLYNIKDDGVLATEALINAWSTKTIKMKSQIVRGHDTGRLAIQVNLGDVVYKYPGSGSPDMYKLDELPETLRKLLISLLAIHKKETGKEANNVIVQLYRSTAGIGPHRDSKPNVQLLAPVTSYSGGYHSRKFYVKHHNGQKSEYMLHPGTVVIFDGNLVHSVPKPYTVAKASIAKCKSERKSCVFSKGLFVCHNQHCVSKEHPCACEDFRLNITIRTIKVVKNPIKRK